MAFTVQVTHLLEIFNADSFGTGGRTVAFEPHTMRLQAADRQHQEVQTLSAGLSAQEITLPPLGASAPPSLLALIADQPVDVRFNSASNAILSAVQQLWAAASISALFVTTGSQVTTLKTYVFGGSGASLVTSPPLP